jgi:hypothetical protein
MINDTQFVGWPTARPLPSSVHHQCARVSLQSQLLGLLVRAAPARRPGSRAICAGSGAVEGSCNRSRRRYVVGCHQAPPWRVVMAVVYSGLPPAAGAVAGLPYDETTCAVAGACFLEVSATGWAIWWQR